MNTLNQKTEMAIRAWSNRHTGMVAEDILRNNTQRAYWDYRTTLIVQDSSLTWAERLDKLSKELCEIAYMDAFDNLKFMREILNMNILKVDFGEIAQVLFEEYDTNNCRMNVQYNA